MSNSTCVGCAAPIQPPRRIWCSPACCNRYRSSVAYHADIEASRAKSRDESRRATLKRWETQGTALRYMRCAICERLFVCAASNTSKSYCSRHCAITANVVRRRDSGRLKDRKRNHEKEREWALKANRKAKANGTYVDSRRCKRCKTRIIGSTTGHCEPCYAVVIKHRKAKARLAAAARGRRTRRVWACGSCLDCGTTFTVLSVGHTPALPFCADCGARRHKRGRKISKTRRLAIYERDDWTCHICGDPVNRRAAHGDLDEPTIDHVIARARGGAHNELNWKTAHRWCNSVKRDLDLADVA